MPLIVLPPVALLNELNALRGRYPFRAGITFSAVTTPAFKKSGWSGSHSPNCIIALTSFQLRPQAGLPRQRHRQR
jgi:hypothetical protein